MKSYLACPICRLALSRADASQRCPGGHSFDIARKGYTHLLPGSRARHGDDREMVLARRRFLEAGHYQPLAEAVSAALAALPLDRPGLVLDAGCGEGYYTAAAARELPHLSFVGIDVSTEAIRAAAARQEMRDGRVSLYVAGVYDMPFLDASFDAVTSLFSPFAREEFWRTLKPGGLLLFAIPGARHLFEMKEVLYDTPYENEVGDYEVEGFTFLGKREVRRQILLKTPGEIADLFTMTPYYYRTPAKGRERLLALPSLSVTVEMELLIYRRSEEAERAPAEA